MKEQFKSGWRWKRCLGSSLDSLFSIQVSFTQSSPPLPSFHPSVLTRSTTLPSPHPTPIQTPLSCHIPPPQLNEVIFTWRGPLIGSQWCSKAFDGEIETNRLEFQSIYRGYCISLSCANWFSYSKILLSAFKNVMDDWILCKTDFSHCGCNKLKVTPACVITSKTWILFIPSVFCQTSKLVDEDRVYPVIWRVKAEQEM